MIIIIIRGYDSTEEENEVGVGGGAFTSISRSGIR